MKLLKLVWIICILGAIFMQSYSYKSFVVDLMRRYKADHWYSNRVDIEFCRAIGRGDTNKMGKMLKEGLDINKRGKNNITFLVYAYLKENKNSYKFLLENGADPNLMMWTEEKIPKGARLKGNRSMLSFAAYDDDPFYLAEALKHGGDPNLKEFLGDGKTSRPILYNAINGGNFTNVQLLIEAGVDVNKGGEVSSPLGVAICNGKYKMAYYLLQKGATNLGVENKDITSYITNFYIARRKITKEEFMNMHPLARSLMSLEDMEYRDKVIEILETKGYKFPERVKKWNWTNE